MRTFSEFTEQLLLISVLGLIGIQVCLLLRLYVLAGFVVMMIVLVGLLIMFRYYFHNHD